MAIEIPETELLKIIISTKFIDFTEADWAVFSGVQSSRPLIGIFFGYGREWILVLDDDFLAITPIPVEDDEEIEDDGFDLTKRYMIAEV